MTFECQECGAKSKRVMYTCRKCGSMDIDVALDTVDPKRYQLPEPPAWQRPV